MTLREHMRGVCRYVGMLAVLVPVALCYVVLVLGVILWAVVSLAWDWWRGIPRPTVMGELAKEYLFTQQHSVYRPLWTYEAEAQGAEVTMYFYSTNIVNPNPKNPTGYPGGGQ